jgi:hypothetical protein
MPPWSLSSPSTILSIIPSVVELINAGTLNLIVDDSNPFSSFILVIAIFAMIAALGVLSVIAVGGFSMMQQQAYGGCERGAAPGTAFNASKGRCFHP